MIRYKTGSHSKLRVATLPNGPLHIRFILINQKSSIYAANIVPKINIESKIVDSSANIFSTISGHDFLPCKDVRASHDCLFIKWKYYIKLWE